MERGGDGVGRRQKWGGIEVEVDGEVEMEWGGGRSGLCAKEVRQSCECAKFNREPRGGATES